MKKTHKVVMLSTEKAEDCLYTSSNKLNYHKGYLTQDYLKNSLNGKSYHLYIISDDEIKEGDWFTTSIDSSKYHHNTPIHQCTSRPKDKDEVFNWVSTVEFTFKPESCKKIVATTDKSLEEEPVLGYQRPLPQLPESFIQAYIKAYNEGKPITEVDLEMENRYCGIGFNHIGKTPTKQERLRGCYDNGEQIVGKWEEFYEYKIKTRPDNTVIVYQSKMYSKEEMIKLIQDKIDEYGGDAQGDIEYIALFCFQDWIEDNL